MKDVWRTVRPLVFAAIPVSIALALAFAPGLTSSQGPQKTKMPTRVQDLTRLLQDLQTDFVFTYDDYEGYLEITACGDKGSVFQAFYRFNGFYVRPILTLSRAKQGQIGYMPNYEDIYEIAPKSTTVNVVVSTTSHCANEVSDRLQTFKASLSGVFLTPAPPATEGIGPGIGRWMYTETKNLKRDGFEIAIRVKSKQPDGGKADLSLFARVMPPGQHYRAWNSATPVVDRTGDIFFDAGGRDSGHEHVTLSKVDWILPGFLPIERPFSLEDISLSYNGSTRVATLCGPPDQTLSDTAYDLKYRFLIAAKKEIDAVLEPADSHEASWEPKPGDIREYKLTLNDPGPEEVQAVRFTLLETSDHPGIATNAGNHVLADTCPDCATGRKQERWPWETFFTNEDGREYAVRREYTHYNSCPIDDLPDMFFRTTDNQGYEMGDRAVSENLKYTLSQQVSRDDVQETGEETYTVKVCVKDGAASAKLRAEVQIGGIWYEARAQGDTAAENGVELLLPLDKDGDGLQDKWESRWGVSEPDRDADSHRGALYPGDGLTVFEEYRGLIFEGRHHRMSPVYKDIFVYDYSGYFKSPLSDVYRKFSAQELSLWNLRMNEFKYDVINYQPGDHKKGDQYIIVIMGLRQNPGLGIDWAGGAAAHVGPPTRESNTIAIKDSRFSHESGVWSWTESAADRTSTAGVLAHEIGHLVNLPHHGENEGYRKVPDQDEEQWVACLGGQHSGDRDCIMAYVRADYFINLTWVPQTDLGRWLSGGQLGPYTDPEGKRLHFCTQAQGSGQCGSASSGRGNCLSQVKVKSY